MNLPFHSFPIHNIGCAAIFLMGFSSLRTPAILKSKASCVRQAASASNGFLLFMRSFPGNETVVDLSDRRRVLVLILELEQSSSKAGQ